MLCVVDEFTREALAILVKRRLSSSDVLEVLAEPVLARGTPSHVRSGNGPESAAVAVKAWPGNLGVNTACIEPGSPWENGHGESFDPKLRDALPDGKIFHSPKLARIPVEGWRRRSNTIRPSAGCRPPPRAASPRQRPAEPAPVNRDDNPCHRPPTFEPDPWGGLAVGPWRAVPACSAPQLQHFALCKPSQSA